MAGFRFFPRWQELGPLMRAEPERFTGTMEDRERGLEAYLDYGEDTFTPELSSTGTFPTLGADGYEAGAFGVQGRRCDWWCEILFSGVGVSAGTGSYLILLPIPPKLYDVSGAAVTRPVGSGMLVDSGTHIYGVTATVVSTTSTTQCLILTHKASPSTWSASNPMVPATGDHLRVSGRYCIEEG